MPKISSDIQRAAAILKQGGLVAMPTETVYGLAADAKNVSAVRKIFYAKERPFDHPLIVHVARIDQLHAWVRDITPMAFQLANTFWPGPLTLIMKKEVHVLDEVTGGQDTIGVRIPHHPVALTLLREFGSGLAAPSANKFTHISPTTASAVAEELGDSVDLILEGGDCTVGLESTILDVTGEQPVILRLGMITAEQIAKVLRIPVIISNKNHIATRAPGMHHLHYAPLTKTQVLKANEISAYLQTLSSDDFPIALITHTIEITNTDSLHVVRLSSEVHSYAHDLYRTLRELDNQKFKRIIVESVPKDPEWDAIRDRLNKASAR